MNPQVGKLLMGVGALLLLIGVIVYLFNDKLNWLGRLPGDVRVEQENFRFYMSIATCVVLTVVINLVLWLIRRFF